MIPLRDDVPSRSVPIVTFALIGLNVAAYIYQLSLGLAVDPGGRAAAEAFIVEFGATPCRLTATCDRGDFPSPYVTIFTSMFLHGSPLHVGGNMLYLWIFGDNVEDMLGHGRFLVFYLLSGVAAATAQTITSPASTIPMIGASGAVSGVLGAYLLLFPYATILTLMIFGFFIRTVHIPALIVLGFWIVLQLINGWLTVSVSAMGRGETGGVAWFAHIGGFLGGMLLLLLFRPRPSRRP
ncbi:MAG TPA: rhomboid family intramembrane serine protease [Methylomirabilota bacterium]|jgi:membrane associated rhomboid family serine protease